MAYNISVKFKENWPGDYTDRWHWLERGIELLRDEGLRYNPNSILIYRELGWFFQHKMGQNLDDANMYLQKANGATEMSQFFGLGGTNFGPLLHPQTAADFQRRAGPHQPVQDRSGSSPRPWMINTGPLTGVLPEAHAIYWGRQGARRSQKEPGQGQGGRLDHRAPHHLPIAAAGFHHGRVVCQSVQPAAYRSAPTWTWWPASTGLLHECLRRGAGPGPEGRHSQGAPEFSARRASIFFTRPTALGEAQQWFNYLGEKYPDKPIIENQPDSLPKNLTWTNTPWPWCRLTSAKPRRNGSPPPSRASCCRLITTWPPAMRIAMRIL